MLNAVAANGASANIDVSDFRHVIVTVNTANNADATLQFRGAISDTAPTFTNAQAVANRWDNIHAWDYEDATGEDGDTGFAFGGADDHRILEINVNGLKWLSAVVTNYVAGNITVRLRRFNNQ